MQRNILRHQKAFQNGDWKLFQVPTDIYMVRFGRRQCPPLYNMILNAWQFSLFIFDFIHAIGGILNIRWAGDGQVVVGFYCVAQGIIKQIGALGTALITLVSPLLRCHHV
jgi:hypothetical protein